jgi:hypothetical protein
MENLQYSNNEILYSYKLFFPNEKNISDNNIKNINPDLLKSVYKKLVFQNHPDRFRYLNLKESELKDRMIKINCAYENISVFLKNKKVLHSYHRSQSSSNKKHVKPKTDIKNQLSPRKKIFFGQFLFYSGNINLNTLLSALSWQRCHRDNFGKIAINWDIIDTKKLVDVLKKKQPFEKIGECALRLGYINNFQLTAILAKQKNLKKPIGEYFIKNNLIDKNEIERFAILHKQHNYLYV